jgi:hypothetical protein
MTMAGWQIRGEYMETCNCTLLCPCITSNLAATPTEGDCKAAVDWAKTRPNVKATAVGVSGWCWGGSTVYQVAATNKDMKGAVAWYGPPARPYQGAAGPVTGFDLAKDIHVPFLGLYGETDQNPKPEDARRPLHASITGMPSSATGLPLSHISLNKSCAAGKFWFTSKA